MGRKKKSEQTNINTEDIKVQHREINEVMRTSYIDYSMSVIIGRALPDVRDGLKPVHRRILYDMAELGVTPDKPHRKSARIVGDVLGKYHPHGDASVYDAMVRLAQDWNIRYPLVDGHGNFGSVDGDSAAAMRYTEARMTPFAMEMLRDMKKDTVDFQPNFDGDEQEPVVLPSRFPNLLVNGSNGIAVGMATSIPPHNLKEVIDAAVRMIEDPGCDIEEIIKIIKGPDFPTGAEIIGKDDAREAYRTGQGKVTVRSKFSIEDGERGKTNLVFTEIPYQVNKAKVIEKIASLVKERRLEGVTDVRDESDRDGMRIVVELRKETNPQVILEKLFKMTSLQENISIIMLALDSGTPRIMNLKEILERYLDHQKEVVSRRTAYDLKKAEERLHIVEGYLIALDDIDGVIRVIRNSYDDARERLMDRFGLSQVQAQAILDMRLARLQGMEREKLEKEHSELIMNISWYHEILSNEATLMGVIRGELMELRDRYGDKRKTAIKTESKAAQAIEDAAEDEDTAYVITHSEGDVIRRIAPETDTSDDESLIARYDLKSKDEIIAITEQGRVCRLGLRGMPVMRKNAKGIAIRDEFGLAARDRILAVLPIRETDIGRKQMLLFTRSGMIKKTELSEFTIDKREFPAMKLREKDVIVKIIVTFADEQEILVVSRGGKCIRFDAGDIAPTGRVGIGVRAINLEDKDVLADAALIEGVLRTSSVTGDLADIERIMMSGLDAGSGYVEVTLERGTVKKALLDDFNLQARGGKGVNIAPKVGLKRNAPVAGIRVLID